MDSVANLLDEHTKRRQVHRKFFEDHAREAHGLPEADPDPPEINVHHHHHEMPEQVAQQAASTTAPTPAAPQLQTEQITGELLEAKTQSPIALLTALLMGIVLSAVTFSILSSKQKPAQLPDNRHSLLQVIEDAGAHVSPEDPDGG